MLSRVRFFLYRQIVSFFSWISFLTQKVYPLEPPTGGAALRFRPYATAFPGMPIGGISRRRGAGEDGRRLPGALRRLGLRSAWAVRQPRHCVHAVRLSLSRQRHVGVEGDVRLRRRVSSSLLRQRRRGPRRSCPRRVGRRARPPLAERRPQTG